MTTTSEEPFSEDPIAEAKDETSNRSGWAARILIPEMWGTLAIGMMWLAVIFVAASDSQVTSAEASGGSTSIPAAVFVAFFAFLGTWAVAKRAYGPKR